MKVIDNICKKLNINQNIVHCFNKTIVLITAFLSLCVFLLPFSATAVTNTEVKSADAADTHRERNNDASKIISLDGKTIYVIGNSHLFYGNCVILGDNGMNDYGYLYHLIRSNGENAKVVDHTYAGRRLDYIYENHLLNIDSETLAEADFVVLAEAAQPNDNLVETCEKIMELFPEDTEFIFSSNPMIYDFGLESVISGIDQLRTGGMKISDWGKMIYDIYTGEIDVPGSSLEYDRCSFIKDNLSNTYVEETGEFQITGDKKHPNLLSGYIAAQSIYTTLTNRSALYSDYSFCGDTSINSKFNFKSFIKKHYNPDKHTNFDEIFQSPRDMVGLQQLINTYNEAEGYHCIIELKGKTPTCTTAGLTTGYKCEACDLVLLEQEIIPSTRIHNPEYTSITQPTCVSPGVTAGAYCSECGEILIKTKIISALGHSFTEKIIDSNHLVSAATYTKPAVYKYDCIRCDCISTKDTYNYGSKLTLGVTGKITATQTLNSVTLSWSKVKSASGYRIKLYDKYSDSWTKIADTNKTTYTVEDLPAGKKYTFMVRAYVIENGKRVYSDSFAEIATATRPRNAKNITSKSTQTTVKLSWDKVNGVSGYRVFRMVNGAWKRVATVTETTYKFTNLKAGKLYEFSVRPIIKTPSGTVLSASGTRYKTATKPQTPIITSITSSDGLAKVVWNNISGETGYQIYYSKSLAGKYTKVSTVSANVTACDISGLMKSETYYFKVRAYKKTDNGNIYSSFSIPVKVKIK